MRTILTFILVGITMNLFSQSEGLEEEFNIGFGWGYIVSRSTTTIANLSTGIKIEIKSDHLDVKISNADRDTMLFDSACNSVKLYFETKDSLDSITTRTFWNCDYSTGYRKEILRPGETALIQFPIFSELKGATTRIKFVTNSGTFYSDWLVI